MKRIGFGGMALVLAACGGGEAAGTGEASVRDSAGIQIVENTGPMVAEGEGWRLSETPIFEVGGDVTDRAYDLNQVVGVARLSDGSIAVANASTAEIRYYNPDGTHRLTSGRSGGGPGEYQIIAGLWRAAGDSLHVLDMGSLRVSVLGPDGAFARAFALGGGPGGFAPGADGSMSLPIPAGVLDDGSLIAMANVFRINDQREGRFRDPMAIVRYGPDGLIRDTIAVVPGLEMEMMQMSFMGQSFSSPSPATLGRMTTVVGRGDRVFIATNDSWEVQVWGPGGSLRQLLRVAEAPRRITPAQVAIHREEYEEQVLAAPQVSMAPQELKDQIVNSIRTAQYPETLPFVFLMLADADGHLWVQEVSVPGDQRQRWGVFNREGRLLTWLRMPERFEPRYVDRDAIVGIWKDADDVEHIRVYGLLRG